MGSDSGPSASDIVREQRRQEVLDYLRARHPSVAQDYLSRKRGEVISGGVGAAVGLFFGFSAVPYSAGEIVHILGPYFGAALGLGAGMLVGTAIFRSSEIIERFAPELVRRRYEAEDASVDIRKLISEKEALRIGHTVIASGGSTVVIDSKNVQIINDIRNKDADVAEALTAISGMIQHLQNAEASDALKNLSESLQQATPSKSKIRAFWNDLVAIAPEVASLGESVKKITSLFL